MTILLSSMKRGDLVVSENGKPYYIVEEVIDLGKMIILKTLWVYEGKFEKLVATEPKTQYLEGAILIRDDTILR